jgi:hypothetical protein
MIVYTRMLYHYLSAMPMPHWFHELSYPCNAWNPSLCLQYLFLLFTTITITAAILLLLLLFHYCHHYKTIATDKPLRARLFLGAVMSTHFYSCRYLLGLQVQRFVEQQQVSLKWITQGLSNSGRLEVKAIPLKQPCNYDTKSLLCPQHTQYACQTYRCTSLAKR